MHVKHWPSIHANPLSGAGGSWARASSEGLLTMLSYRMQGLGSPSLLSLQDESHIKPILLFRFLQTRKHFGHSKEKRVKRYKRHFVVEKLRSRTPNLRFEENRVD